MRCSGKGSGDIEFRCLDGNGAFLGHDHVATLRYDMCDVHGSSNLTGHQESWDHGYLMICVWMEHLAGIEELILNPGLMLLSQVKVACGRSYCAALATEIELLALHGPDEGLEEHSTA